eukprot:IDg6954t1
MRSSLSALTLLSKITIELGIERENSLLLVRVLSTRRACFKFEHLLFESSSYIVMLPNSSSTI